MKNIFAVILFTTLLSSLPKDTLKNKSSDWDITIPHGPSKEINFETTEGTWMSIDVSPDGKNLVFDLLGDIYLLPIAGGDAKLILGGNAYETQPRFSPNGKLISFTSDRSSCDNIWIMNNDGTNLQQVTKEKERQVMNACWTPDGKYIIARKHYRNTRSLGSGEMWLYHFSGGDGSQITKRKNWEQDAGEPIVSADGKFLFYSEDITGGGGFQYNKNPHEIIYAIKKINLESGKTEFVANSYGGAARPEISPDGKTLAFVRRVGTNSALYLQDLKSGEEKMIYDKLDHDQQEAWAIFGVYPSFTFTPDGKSIIFWAGGKINKIEIDSKKVSGIPFKAKVTQTITDALHFEYETLPKEFDVKTLRWVNVSPDRKKVMYQALGHIYLKDLQIGTPYRLTNDNSKFEFHPSFSADGKFITFTTWSDESKGAVWKSDLSGKNIIKLTTESGHFTEPSFSNDGKKIIYRKIGGDNLRGLTNTRETGIYIVSTNGGESEFITDEGTNPKFNFSGNRIFLNSHEGDKFALISFDIFGRKKQIHFTSENATQVTISPNEEWIAFTERFNAYIFPFPKTGQAINISPNTNEYPIKKVSRDAGNYLHFSSDNKTLFWSLGPELFSRDLTNTFKFVEGAKDSITQTTDSTGIFIGFKNKSDIPNGRIALVGAKIITMDGNKIINNGTVVIENNRILAIGDLEKTVIPPNTKLIDVHGKFIMPGIIDVHAHLSHGSNGITPQQSWTHFANLAFGVTTTHDPSNSTEMVFAASELQKAGIILAPRIFSNGTILYGAEAQFKAVVNNFDDALSHLRRLKSFGAFSVKSYNQPRRDQRQQFIEAARKLNMLVVPEGGSTFFWNMTMILDGHTGIEHAIPIAPLYNDIKTFWSSSQTTYTPTLLVAYGGLSGEYYWYEYYDAWTHPILTNFFPNDLLNARSRRRLKTPENDYFHKTVSASATELNSLGVNVQLGAHGQLQGLGAHWEIWSLAQGGASPIEVIKMATINGAKYIGMEKDLGSLEIGKLADLIVMNKNPLEDIRNTDSIIMVMLNGRLFESKTLNEIGNYNISRKPLYFKGLNGFGKNESYENEFICD